MNLSAGPFDAISGVQITGLWSLLYSIDWTESWLWGLIAFHGLCLLVTYLTRKLQTAQIVYFFLLLLLTYSAEYINEVAAMNWRSFAKYQYFDSQGLFISVVFSTPLLLNAMIIVVMWICQMSSVMAKIKAEKIKKQLEKEKNKKTD
ncbi:transmembrane protein 18 isoform X1 [Petromyzon marinus]|uniref:Transmembrane protein 18 n=2 Tax=Petromyzon marinus TaxID=7757 RepID=A0AAJ7TJJ8_PETMA|nr:transmembrane protein 18 isoform X1 [Petromyzon marinus]